MIHIKRYNENKMECLEDCLIEIFDEFSIENSNNNSNKNKMCYYQQSNNLFLIDLIPIKYLSIIYDRIVEMKSLIEKRIKSEIEIKKRVGSSCGFITIYSSQIKENNNNYNWPIDKIDELTDYLQEFFDKYNIIQKKLSDVRRAGNLEYPFWFIDYLPTENKNKRRSDNKISPKYIGEKRYIVIDICPPSSNKNLNKNNFEKVKIDLEGRKELIEKRLKNKIKIKYYPINDIIYIEIE